MKNKLRIICKYLKGMGIDKAPFRIDFENGVQWFELDVPYDISDTIRYSISEILEIYEDDLYEIGPGSLNNPNEYFTVSGEIIPSENKIIIEGVDFQGYNTEGSGSHYDIEDYEEGESVYNYFIQVRKFLDEIKSDSITITYEGGGDSGYIQNHYESSNGGGDVPAGIEDICYKLLEEFGGWEINEGSQGSIMLSRNEIDVEHEWNVQEELWEEANIVITPETFNE
jgi:hypothetical protein